MVNKKNILNEKISEDVTDFTNFHDYKQGLSRGREGTFGGEYYSHQKKYRATENNGFFVYQNVDSVSIKNIKLNGSQGAAEFFKTMCYGRGMYTMLDFDDAKRAVGGDAIVKYYCKKGGLNNFIVDDDKVREVLKSMGAITTNETYAESLKRLLGKHYDLVMRDSYRTPSMYSVRNILNRGEGRIKLRPGMSFDSETRLDETDIDGWAYFGYGNIVCVFRSTDMLMPYKYYLCRHGEWPSENEGEWCITDEDRFEKLNHAIDGFRRGRKDYPDTPFTTKTIHGLSLVGGKGKYNMLIARTGKYFSPDPFDECTSVDSNTGTFVATMKNQQFGSEKGDFKIWVRSLDNARDFEIKWQFVNKDRPFVEWPYCDNVITYEQFLSLFGGALNESVKEAFTDMNYDEFKNYLSDDNYVDDINGSGRDEYNLSYGEDLDPEKGKRVYVYTVSDRKNIKSIMTNGLNAEFMGTSDDSSIYYGVGAYCSYGLYGARLNTQRGYGDVIFKFLLKDGFKDFLIFDGTMRRKHDPGKTVYDEIIELVPEKYLQKLGDYTSKNYALNASYRQKGLHYYDSSPRFPQSSGPLAKNFYEALKGAMAGKLNRATYYTEKAIAESKVRGYVFNGNVNPQTAFIRDFNSLIPVAFSLDKGKTWITKDMQGNDYLSRDVFDKLNQNVNPYYKYRGEYADTELLAKQNCGFSLVKDAKKGYNYYDIWTHTRLLPVDADYAIAFNSDTRTCKFSYDVVIMRDDKKMASKQSFAVSVDDKGNLNIQYEQAPGMLIPLSPQHFTEFIDTMYNGGMFKNSKTYYNDNMLNPDAQAKFSAMVQKHAKPLNEGVNVTNGRESYETKLQRLVDVNGKLNDMGLPLFKDGCEAEVTKGISAILNCQGKKKMWSFVQDAIEDYFVPNTTDKEAANYIRNLFGFHTSGGYEKYSDALVQIENGGLEMRKATANGVKNAGAIKNFAIDNFTNFFPERMFDDDNEYRRFIKSWVEKYGLNKDSYRVYDRLCKLLKTYNLKYSQARFIGTTIYYGLPFFVFRNKENGGIMQPSHTEYRDDVKTIRQIIANDMVLGNLIMVSGNDEVAASDEPVKVGKGDVPLYYGYLKIKIKPNVKNINEYLSKQHENNG